MEHGTHREAHRHHDYLPGTGWHWLMPIYDTVHRMAGVAALHRELVDRAELGAGQRVLDVGCGTGNLLVAVRAKYPDVDAVGIDPDERALARARRKLGAGSVRLDRGYAGELPYAEGTFQRVLSTLMFHHLDAAEKDGMLSEVRRVLAPGGLLLLADFAGGVHPAHGWLARWTARSPRLQDNVGDAIPSRMRAAGLVEPVAIGHCRTRIGWVTVFRAAAPPEL